MADNLHFNGGPLADYTDGVHSLIVHMKGNGQSAAGAYVQVEDGVFEWNPKTMYDQDENVVKFDYKSDEWVVRVS